MTSALLVIDMQNAFLHPDGENYYPAAPEIVAPAQALIAAARHSGTIIVHVADVHRF
jgi:maleamate amidohydrolase